MNSALFLIPRYQENYDSDAQEEETSADKLEKVLKKVRKRKRKFEKLNGLNYTKKTSDVEIAAMTVLEKEKINEEALSGKFGDKDLNSMNSIKIETKTTNHRQSLQNSSNIENASSEVSRKSYQNERMSKTAKILNGGTNTVPKECDEVEPETREKRNKKHKKSNKKKGNDKQREMNIEGFTIIGEIDVKMENVQRVLPNWLANPTIIDVDINGKKCAIPDLDYLDSNTKSNLIRNGIDYLFPVQTAVIPYLMKTGGQRRLWMRPSDICVSAPTGSGKTLAYVLPIVQCLRERLVPRVRALVVLPVGDLAFQVFKVFNSYCKGTDLHVALVTGQKSFVNEQDCLVKKYPRYYLSLVDIIVATPGRLLDHINHTPGFSLEGLRYLVIDEADRMMDEIQQGWLKKVENAVFKNAATSGCCCFSAENLFKRVSNPPTTACEYNSISEPLIKLLYSATLSQDPEKLHDLSLYDPILYTTVGMPTDVQNEQMPGVLSGTNLIEKYTTPESLKEFHVICDPAIKPLVICQLIYNGHFKRVLCFTKSRENSHRLYLLLNEMGDVTAREISSNLSGIQRKIILEQFTSGKINIVVCSDLMARGMDIENVDCVISYDSPDFIKTYIHRVGRTARAGREGTAITLLDIDEEYRFMKMLKDAGKPAIPLFNFDFQSLKTLESRYKIALNAVSRTTAHEKRKKYFLKGSLKNQKKNKIKVLNARTSKK